MMSLLLCFLPLLLLGILWPLFLPVRRFSICMSRWPCRQVEITVPAHTHTHVRSRWQLSKIANGGWRMSDADADFRAEWEGGGCRCRRYAAAGKDNGPKSPSWQKTREFNVQSSARVRRSTTLRSPASSSSPTRTPRSLAYLSFSRCLCSTLSVRALVCVWWQICVIVCVQQQEQQPNIKKNPQELPKSASSFRVFFVFFKFFWRLDAGCSNFCCCDLHNKCWFPKIKIKRSLNRITRGQKIRDL